MPFYDAKYLILDGRKINEDNILNKQTIKTVLPYDNKENLLIALTKENYKTISKIKVVFNNDETKEYTVKFRDTYGNVANYQINELQVGYNFNTYIIEQNAGVVR